MAELHPVHNALAPDEPIEAQAQAGGALMIVTDRRLVVGSEDRLLLDLPVDQVRRIQFDIEKHRPATLVIVPESRRHDPQVLAVPSEEYDRVGRILTVVGHRLAALPHLPSAQVPGSNE